MITAIEAQHRAAQGAIRAFAEKWAELERDILGAAGRGDYQTVVSCWTAEMAAKLTTNCAMLGYTSTYDDATREFVVSWEKVT